MEIKTMRIENVTENKIENKTSMEVALLQEQSQ